MTRNQQFVCQGANYRQYMIESGMNPEDKQFDMIFNEALSCISPADTDVILHEFVAGLVIVDDCPARDVQAPQMQFCKRKSFRSFGPVGPRLCLLEPADRPQLKRLHSR